MNILVIDVFKIQNFGYKNNILKRDYNIRKRWTNDCKHYIEKISLGLLYKVYLRLPIIVNIIKYYSEDTKTGKEKYNKLLDLYLIISLTVEIFIYCFSIYYKPYYDFMENIIVSYFFWRIITITTIRLNEILSFQFKEALWESFNRSIFCYIINFIEITIGFAFLYSSKYFHVFTDRNFSTIYQTLNIYTEWNLQNNDINNISLISDFSYYFKLDYLLYS